MAFHQPAVQPSQRPYHHLGDSGVSDVARQPEQSIDEDQEWILFSPAPASTTYQTNTTSTGRTGQTLGHSRNSAFGSLDTAARSYEYDEDGSEQTEAALDDEEDGELDSLDSHLHEFRADPSVYRNEDDLRVSSNPVLPTHDGLGSFRIDQTAMGEGVQQHLYAFEQYNPRRVKRRRESLEIGQMELENDRVTEMERTRRIEAWRLEQSRALLEEIQRESRRRRQSVLSEPRSLLHDTDDAEAASLSADPAQLDHGKDDGLWSRITRRVIQDLMGIDDNLLNILFGECLPEDEVEAELSSTPKTLAHLDSMKQDSWEYRLLDRVARELGLLINQLSDHPGSFSTYLAVSNDSLPYAGLPIIPESRLESRAVMKPQSSRRISGLSSSIPQFHPTLPAAIAIPGTSVYDEQAQDLDATPRAAFPIHAATVEYKSDDPADFTKEDWEKQLDIKMVFRYLRSRFTSRATLPEPTLVRNASFPPIQSPHHIHPHQNEARAARVRQHHPLVGRHVEKKGMAAANKPILHRRSSSSCASFKRESLKRNSVQGSGTSRHYWDLGGSLGSGSFVASGGGMGAWGEV